MLRSRLRYFAWTPKIYKFYNVKKKEPAFEIQIQALLQNLDVMRILLINILA